MSQSHDKAVFRRYQTDAEALYYSAPEITGRRAGKTIRKSYVG